MRRKLVFAALSAALALALCGAVCACGSEPQHLAHAYGEWTVTEPTCTEAGSRTRACTHEGCTATETQVLPALGHDFDSGTVTVEATCTEGGTRTRTCRRCGTTKTAELAPLGHDWVEGRTISAATCTEAGRAEHTCSRCDVTEEYDSAALGHDWNVKRLSNPTCTAAGSEQRTCNRCTESETVTLEALGHSWNAGEVVTEADCTHEGLLRRTCTRGCGATDEVVTEALGHDLEEDFTIDTPATFEHAGEKSRHCARGCGFKAESTVIPQLNDNTPIVYEFRLLRNNGEKLNASASITVYESDGVTVAATGAPADFAGGVFTAELRPRTYTVRVTDLPAGYSAEESYTVEALSPVCPVYLTAHLLEGQAPSGTRYRVGSVMYDFTIPASETNLNKEIKLSEVLATKKMVFLNFWYTTCTYCIQEFPYLQASYTENRADVEVLAIDPIDASMGDICAFMNNLGLTFPAMKDSAKLREMFGVTSYPTSFVIDGEGVVCAVLEGASEKATFDYYFEKYTAESGRNDIAASLRDVALPAESGDSGRKTNAEVIR